MVTLLRGARSGAAESTDSRDSARPKGRRPSGQMLVMFILSIFVLTGVTAIVVDISWYWANSLRVQRAADAAATAGVVWLPDTPSSATSTALAEATKNGFTDGSNGVTVTAQQDSTVVSGGSDHQLDVTIKASVNTFFMRIFGVPSLPITRKSQAQFNLAIPMGSPDNWYGVGNFYQALRDSSGPDEPPCTSSGYPSAAWTNPGNACSSNSTYATDSTNVAQQYYNFALSVPSTDTVIGMIVSVQAKSSVAGCQIAISVSRNGGANWSAADTQALTTTNTVYTFGAKADPWEDTSSNDMAWVPGDFSAAGNTNFRVKVQNVSSSGCTTDTVSLDDVNASVFANKQTSTLIGNASPSSGQAPAAGLTAPTSRGFFGAVITAGGQRGNGDRYSPLNDSQGTGGLNADYDADGYDYTISFAPGITTGKVWLYDPEFCALGTTADSGGTIAAGDHWIGAVGDPVTTVYTLYDTNGLPFSVHHAGYSVVATDTESNQVQADLSGLYGQPVSSDAISSNGIRDCSADAHHNQWVLLAQNLTAGTYHLNVNTSSAANSGTNAENMFSIYAGATGAAANAVQIYGGGRMVGYNQVPSGTSRFYLAKVASSYASKAMTIELFDIGDSKTTTTIQVMSPVNGSGSDYTKATFDYTSDANCQDGVSDSCAQNGRQSITTTNSSGRSSFNNTVITMTIKIPSDYGATNLEPTDSLTGKTETQPGWWKIQETSGLSNDTTTWNVNIQGNPVHLIAP